MTKSPDPTIAIYNDKSSGETDATVEAIVAAYSTHVHRDFAPFHHTAARIEFVPSTRKPPKNAWVIAILSNSDEAGALGYHDLTPSGLPLGKVFAATDRHYGEKLSVTVCHEGDEMLGDPWINLAAEADDGRFYAYELCDAVEADDQGYDIDGQTMSNFVTPHWFGHGAGQYDFMNKVTAPFQLLPGGYISVLVPGSSQGWTQIYGATAKVVNTSAVRPDVSYHSRARVGSRRERRRIPRHLWQPSTYKTA